MSLTHCFFFFTTVQSYLVSSIPMTDKSKLEQLFACYFVAIPSTISCNLSPIDGLLGKQKGNNAAAIQYNAVPAINNNIIDFIFCGFGFGKMKVFLEQISCYNCPVGVGDVHFS